MRQLRVRDAIEFGDDPDYFGAKFQAFKPKPKRALPKADNHVKTKATEDTDQQIRKQIRLKVPLDRIVIMHVSRVSASSAEQANAGGGKKPRRRKHEASDNPYKVSVDREPLFRQKRRSEKGELRVEFRADITPRELADFYKSEQQAEDAPDSHEREQLVEIKVGLSERELARFYERERQRYFELSGHAGLLKHGSRKVKERAKAHAILKGFANGIYHRDATATAWDAMRKLTEGVDARQLAHVMKVTDKFPLTLEQRVRLMQLAPRRVFLNKRILQPFLDRVMRDKNGAPVTESVKQMRDMATALPLITKSAMQQSLSVERDEDCVTPGDLFGYLDALGEHETVKNKPFYAAALRTLERAIQRVSYPGTLSHEDQKKLDAAFAASTRLLAEPMPAPAVVPAALRPAAPRQRQPKAQNPAA